MYINTMIRKQVMLTEQDIKDVQADADKRGLSFSEILRRLISRFYRGE